MNKVKTDNLILGIDLVLVRSGVAVISANSKKAIYVGAVESKKLKGMERVEFIVNSISELLNTHKVTEAVIEGYAMYASGRITDLAEICGIIRYELHKRGIPFTVMAPKTMVKRITGYGNNDKNDVRKIINKRLKLDLSEKQNDESDACGLALARIDELNTLEDLINAA